jgi:thiamine biosynthesis lipoprotein
MAPAMREALCGLGFEVVQPSVAETEVHRVGRDGFRLEARRPAMTTRVSVTALHESTALGEDATGRAFDEMDRLIAIFNRHDAASALSVLNDEGRLEGPPPELPMVLSEALSYHRLTDGAFDPTVAPLVDLFRDCLTSPVPHEPTAAEIAAVRALVGASAIATSRRRVRLMRIGAALTLDGIAKGFIVDRMAATLERAGITRYLVEAGGDIRTGGLKEDGLPWAVAVRDPESGGTLPGTMHLSGAAVATSGCYERYYDPTRRFHHIVDAAHGTSPRACTSATVVAPRATAADALATAVLVLGTRAGVALVESLPGCACLIVCSDGSVTHSHGWKESPQ